MARVTNEGPPLDMTMIHHSLSGDTTPVNGGVIIFRTGGECFTIYTMDKLYREIGERMKSIRSALKMTQAQVAEAAEIETSFYGHIERGANIPSLKTFVAIAAALKANPADLFPTRISKTDRLSETAIESILSDLSPSKKSLIVGIVKDIASGYHC